MSWWRIYAGIEMMEERTRNGKPKWKKEEASSEEELKENKGT